MRAQGLTMKRALRSIRDSVSASLAPGRMRRIKGPELLVLMYHRVLPPDHVDIGIEQPGMMVTPPTLDMHLSVLKSHLEAVHLDDWVRGRLNGDILPRLAFAVTFDDGWRDNYDHALPVLERHAVPATVFLVTDLVGTHYPFWPNRLARALAGLRDATQLQEWPERLRLILSRAGVSTVPVDRRRIDAAIESCKVLGDDELQRLLDQLPRQDDVAGQRDLMSWDEVRHMAKSGLVRFGSHTRRHTRLLATLDAATLIDEGEGSSDVLHETLGQRPSLFCYPNGNYDPAALRAVSGRYLAAVSTHTGWNSQSTPLHELRRVGVHEDVSSTRAGLLHRLVVARRA